MATYRIKGLANTPQVSGNGYRIKGLAQQSSQENVPVVESKPSLRDVPSDIADSFMNLVMGAGNKAMQLPEEISDAAQQLGHHPFSTPPRAAQGILSGLLEGGKQVFNMPLNLNTYLGSKGVFPFKQTMGLAEKLKIGDTGLQKAVMGDEKPGDQLWQDIGQAASMIAAPEAAGVRVPGITSRGITNQLSRHKAAELAQARRDYGQLFTEANQQGFSRVANPGVSPAQQRLITQNSRPIHHRALNDYLENPTLENAHWAQSELGALERHMESIANKNGLTPIQHQTLRAANDARQQIRQSMFNQNGLGASPELAQRYQQLSNQYRENVIPYTRLEDLSEVEAGRMRPSTAVKSLLKDDQFMIELSRRYPGLLLHTPTAKKIGLGALGLTGYDEIKKLMHNGG
jgi:hypothetical protein